MVTSILLLASISQAFRPPAAPLVACDPYFSIWSMASRLTDRPTEHWTQRPQRLTSLVRIDGKPFRIMGDRPASVPPLHQDAVEVLPTRTLYRFSGHGVKLSLTFTTPALPGDLDLLSRPVTYLTWDVASADGRRHDVSLYYDNTAEPTVDEPTQAVVWAKRPVGDLATLKFGSVEQPILRKTGDDRRIDWGYLYAASPQSTQTAIAPGAAAEFAARGDLPASVASRPTAAKDAPVGAFAFRLGKVGVQPVSRWLALAYDDLYSIQYFHQNLRPYWRRNGRTANDLLRASERQYAALRHRCEAFDRELMADLRQEGGEHYAEMAALAYRQCLAGNKIAADAHGQPLLFPKENTSNGCIGTVDVIFPMAPEFLLFGPSLTKAMIVSNLDYASSSRWKWPFAPHDLGTYPKANGQVYGGGERTEDDQMPVEETGNMLILVDALAQMEGNPRFAVRYWPTLQKWARFLKAKGFDPENQLSTDDFMGHLAHNTNLSIKAILGLASYADLCRRRGLGAEAAGYESLARRFAQRWVREANDGDHFRLAFDKPGSWSQKYNMVWDAILGFHLFPEAAKRKEMAFYRKMLHPYGVALDSREGGTLAKADWSLWTATLTGDPGDFRALSEPVYRYLNDSPERVPFGDAYDTVTSHHRFMDARPVVGGVFLKMLYDKPRWRKWAHRDVTLAMNWAPFPKPFSYRVVVPTAEKQPATWRYTTDRPAAGWFGAAFDDSTWQTGPGGFGTKGTPGIVVGTTWETPDIWIRRTFALPSKPTPALNLRLFHDEDAEVYVNGVLIAHESGYVSAYDDIPLDARARAALHPGQNVIAIHCHQTTGGQGIDAGFDDVANR